MNDTTEDIERLVREKYMAMSGEKRFMIGVRMFDTARKIALASLPVTMTPAERRKALCRRFYGAVADRISW